MFEKEIKFISDFSLNKIKNLGSFFTFDKLTSVGIHPAIVKYISAELDYLIYEDRRKLLQQSVFDYSGAEINKLFVPVNEQLKKTKRISYEDIKKLVIQAVSFNINFVARPKWSLGKLVFDTAENKSADEIKLMLNYLFYYDYIKTIVLSYLNKRKFVSLSLTEFELLLNKIDKEIFSPANSPSVIDNAIYCISDFFSIGGTSKTKISPAPLEIFLKEKNLMDYLFRLRKALPPTPKGSFETEEIRKVIYSTAPFEQQIILEEKEEPEEQVLKELYNSMQQDEETLTEEHTEEITNAGEDLNKDEQVPVIEELEEVPEEMELKDDELIIESPADDELLRLYDEELKQLEKESEEIHSDIDEIKFDIEKKDELSSLYEFEVQHDGPIEPGTSDEEEEPEQNEPAEEKYDPGMEETFHKLEIPSDITEEDFIIQEPLEKNDEPETEKTAFVTVPEEKKEPEKILITKDLFTYFSDKDIDKIIDNVFNEDREDFTSTMERISECDNYNEATEIIKGVFHTYRVNPYARDAVTLTNAVSNYFNQV